MQGVGGGGGGGGEYKRHTNPGALTLSSTEQRTHQLEIYNRLNYA